MPARSVVDEVASAVADDDPIDWARVGDGEGAHESRQIAALRRLAAWRAARADADTPVLEARLDPLARLVAAVAAIKVLAAIAGFVTSGPTGGAIPAWWQFGMVTAFAAAACWLWAGGAADVRSRHLAILFLLAAASYGRRFGDLLVPIVPPSLQPWWSGLAPEAFMPYAAWHFARRFPRSLRLSLADLVTARGVTVAGSIGVVLAAATLTASVLGSGSVVAERLAPIARLGTGDLGFWALAGVPTVAAFVASLVRSRHATPAERQRVAVFFGAFVVASAPLYLEICAELVSPSFSRHMSGPAEQRVLAGTTYLLIGTMPFVTAYSVTVHRLLSVSVIVRRAVQWALARWLLTAVTVAPLAALAWYAAGHRDLTIATLVESRTARVLLASAIAGVVLLLARERLAARVDAAFETPEGDLQQAFTSLTSDLRGARDERDAIAMVERGAARVLGASSARVYVAGPDDAFVPARGDGPALACGSAIHWLLSEDDAPIDLSSSGRLRARRLLPAADCRWAEDLSAAIAAPIRSPSGELAGLLVVGARDNGFELAHRERVFVAGVAHALALTARPATTAGNDRADADPASECERCGRVLPPDAHACPCGGVLATAAVPAVLAGKFRIERVAGRGGMGVVYQAVDVVLGRTVAVKTLPRLSRDADRRLREEARVMASVPHSHVAAIHGIETWRGATMLIVEYLDGGTLAARAANGPLPWLEVVRTGLQVADGLAALHAAVILHRDVKPSNIGFAADGQVKLLDFGVASARVGEDASVPSHDAASPSAEATYLAGTPLYLSPELASGAAAAATDDLWALAMVLYEALAGAHPFAGRTMPAVLAAARRGRVPRLEASAAVPRGVSDFLAVALHPSLNQRPASAAGFRERLAQAAAVTLDSPAVRSAER